LCVWGHMFCGVNKKLKKIFEIANEKKIKRKPNFRANAIKARSPSCFSVVTQTEPFSELTEKCFCLVVILTRGGCACA